MTPVSFSWDTEKRSITFKWNGFFSFGWEKGKVLKRIFGFPIPNGFKRKKIHFPMRWIHLKEGFSFLSKWKLKKVEGTFSFPDPMVNGLLYGWVSAMESTEAGRKFNVSINFLGENRCSGEAVISVRTLLQHFKKWFFLIFRDMMGRPKRGGESRWMLRI
jgi:hypothetical protein